MGIAITNRGGRRYGHGVREENLKELMEKIYTDLYDPEGILGGDGSTIPEESWEEIKLETSVKRNKAARAAEEERCRKRQGARRRAGIRRLILRCAAGLAVVMMAALSVYVGQTTSWWVGGMLMLASCLIQCGLI